ncbi:TfuA-like protein [Agrobacterium arsenijevicii]|uniref:TfuA-like core domain-containing protein n=1 Tax=Agrobacterium arsenijevicii TaxID=1585697 RepID=A0ABR5D7Q7_9HYPH|nr:TfuA-like core domain-containing protein [Agrobacterium arsenijevicii]
MKPVVFAGPSIHGIAPEQISGLDLRGPAACGDIFDAVRRGARTIGLIDGLYGDCAAVWHKEILFALSGGVTVVGAASMGALRAAECAAFGMIGIGEIFEAFRDGQRFSDADVAVSHAPRELDYRPLTIALVDAEATLEACRGSITQEDHDALLHAARKLHFTRRTWRSIAAEADLSPETANLLAGNAVSVKRNDAARLLGMLGGEELPSPPPQSWKFQNTVFFQQLATRQTAGEKAS